VSFNRTRLCQVTKKKEKNREKEAAEGSLFSRGSAGVGVLLYGGRFSKSTRFDACGPAAAAYAYARFAAAVISLSFQNN
jgi:hypothetical protein